MITIHEGSRHTLESRVRFDDLLELLVDNGGDIGRIGGLAHDYLVDDLGVSDSRTLGQCASGLEHQVPAAPLTEMGVMVYKNMFSRGFRAARELREGVHNV